MRYGKIVRNIPGQMVPEPGLVQNNAGGFVYAVDEWTRLDRFLILGSDAGTYYVGEQKATADNMGAVKVCLGLDPARTIGRIVEISKEGRAPKNDPAIFALAMAAASDREAVRRIAMSAIPEVCRTGTHIFTFADCVQSLRGWGRGLRRGVGAWYSDRPADRLAYQLVKYRQRGGWTHRDLLRLSHPKKGDEAHRAVIDWLCGRDASHDLLPPVITDFVDLQAEGMTPERAAEIIARGNVPWEALPTDLLKSPIIWQTLIRADSLPTGAMLRNLGRMTANGTFSGTEMVMESVCATLNSAEALTKARIHPVAVAIAKAVYTSGRGVRGSMTWTPEPKIMHALENAFLLSFKSIVPTNKRMMLALDVSGSMDGAVISGTPLTARDGAAIMAMATARSEPNYSMTAFSSGSHRGFNRVSGGITKLNVTQTMGIDHVIKLCSQLPFCGTDCALPMLKAMEWGEKYDAFVVYTDNETWAGHTKPAEALRQYRKKTGIPAKLVVVGMTSTGFSIADPSDAGMMDVVGFDAAAPAVISDFIGG